jgi:radical SAM protein with 4Fe4S-binding SPASM domain
MLDTHEGMGRPINLSVSSFTKNDKGELKESLLYRRLLEAGVKPGLKWRVDNWGGLVSKVGGGLWLMGPPRHKGPCALLYDSSVLVLPDGRVTPCHCRDLEGELHIGNVMQNSLEDIWSGDLLSKLREEQGKGIFGSPCGRCSAYTPIRHWFTRERNQWLVEYDRRVPTVERFQS